MINFKSFIGAIHDAILKANDALMDKNVALLNKYFEETEIKSDDNKEKRTVLSPKSVILDYPCYDESNKLTITEIHVPLITMVPLATSQIEKATFTAEFEMQIIDGELQIDFVNKSNSGSFFKKSRASKGTLEITISPQATSEGLRLLIEGYETILKKQIP